MLVVETYTQKDERQLLDRCTYLKLKSDPTKKYKVTLTSLVNEGATLGIFNSRMCESLIPQYPVVSIFHHLPKTHRGLNPLQGRPIISDF